LEGDLVRHELAGRVLSIKITQHTFAQAVRQRHLPRLVWKKEDLYEYAIPLLAKLESDLKPLRLRLLGLRMTSLSSTKKDDNATKDFFKITQPQKKRKPTDDNSRLSATEDAWESWPEDEWARPDSAMGFEYSADSPEPTSYQPVGESSHGKDVRSEQPVILEETWSCPICARDQPANDKQFNEHVDFCLSKQTIKEAVSEADQDDKSTAKMSKAESPFKQRVDDDGGDDSKKPVLSTFDMMLMGRRQQQTPPSHKGKKRKTK